MSYEQKPNSGSLFANRDRKSDKHPHASGSAIIDGVEYYVDAWTNDGQKGKWQSLRFKPKQAQRTSYEEPRQTIAQELDDEIPF